ncbi:PqqD family protein [Clostridium sp. UBA1652]|uniref:PqqD family protein n=1 Tax=Clostridium sp. UBA1652 TaxID=1946348 RepID=UPI00257B1C3C|nr:PqqD family protein [Clostridium sp. UBA1652]
MNDEMHPVRENIRWRWDGETGEYITYLNRNSGAISIMNPAGALVFSLSDGTKTVAEIIDYILEEFRAPDREIVAKDVRDFLDYMEKTGAVRMEMMNNE